MSNRPVRRPVKPPVRRVVKKKPAATKQTPAPKPETNKEDAPVPNNQVNTPTPPPASSPPENRAPAQEPSVTPAPASAPVDPVQSETTNTAAPTPTPKAREEKPKSTTSSRKTPPPPPPSDSDEQKKGKSRVPLIIVIVLLLGVGGVLAYLLQDTKKELKVAKEDLAVLGEEKDKEIADAQNRLQEMIDKYNVIREERESLGAKNDDLLAQIEDLEKQKAYWARKANSGMSAREKARMTQEMENLVANYKDKLAKKEEEITRLKQMNGKLNEHVNQLVEKQGVLSSELTTMEDRMAAASVLYVETIEPGVVNYKGKFIQDDSYDYKNKNIDKIRVVCTIADNKIAEHGPKSFWLQIVDPEGTTLFDAGSGGGTELDKEGNTVSVTAEKSVHFENTKEKIIFSYAQPKEYKDGEYKVTIWSSGHKVGESKFSLF